MSEFERVKVLVVGDSGVGKTALVHLLCNQQPLTNPCYTVGCSLDVKVHQFRADPSQERPFFIELWDVGGCNAHANTRSVFYHGAHGLILVYDCTNSKSEANLKKWLSEVLHKTPCGSLESVNYHGSTGVGKVTNFFSHWSPNEFPSGLRARSLEKNEELVRSVDTSSSPPIPVLMVGTKLDLLDWATKRQISQRVDEGRCFTDSAGWNNSLDNCHALQSASLTLPQSFPSESMMETRSASVFVNLNGPPNWLNAAKSSVDRNVDLGFPKIFLSCNSASSVAPNSWNAVLLDKFFDDVIQTKLSGTSSHGSHSPDAPKIRRSATDFGMGRSTGSFGPPCKVDDHHTRVAASDLMKRLHASID
ncbi:GTP-binding domain protein [Paragonimus heterotremus]|uniref:GTP-binding domain protein n=1 Tax=Paragonimus heterotremus TaxID=100268 RepID=A0A8J4TPZ1_9TREM|nr:GTP-binding domain protein [Paragonimus heterotremus]